MPYPTNPIWVSIKSASGDKKNGALGISLEYSSGENDGHRQKFGLCVDGQIIDLLCTKK